MALAACGGDDGGASATDSRTDNGADQSSSDSSSASGNNSGGDVVDPQPPGQATASVDGEDYTFNTLGPVGCAITDTEFNVGFLIGDNEVSFIAGGSLSGSEWRGRIDLNVQTADGITNYFADFSSGDEGAVAVSGASMSYSGPWLKFGSGGEEESVGDGTLSVTCG